MPSARFVPPDTIANAVKAAIARMYCSPDSRVIDIIRQYINPDNTPLARDILKDIVQNAEIAARDRVPTCQDTGSLVVWVEYGSGVHLGGADPRGIIEQAAADAWRELSLRDSIVADPLLDRSIVTSPLPVVLHIDLVPGDGISFHLAMKGGGSENKSALRMFPPTTPEAEIRQFIADTAVEAGGMPCPPVLVGVGIGGNFELCAVLAKKALFHLPGTTHRSSGNAGMEERILSDINARGSGPMGMGGSPTALAVRILAAPCHIASLPVAVNIQCHAHRHHSFTL